MRTDENKRVIYEFGNFVLDPNERTLFSNGTPIHLPSKEFDTLLLLVAHNGHALSKDEMLSTIWQGVIVEESNLTKQISRLRKIFDGSGERFIETLPKYGYRFTADLRPIAVSDDEDLVFERRTVKRLTVDFPESEPIGEVIALPAAPRRYSRVAIGLGILLIISVVGFRIWRSRRDVPPAVDPYAPVRLTDHPNDDTGPVWTKDGRIRFTRFQTGNRPETWIMNADGTEQSLVVMPAGKRVLSWSPDEKKVLYQKDGDAEKTFLSNADGSGEVELPFRGGLWSADSKLLTYHQRVSGPDFEIFIYDLETGVSRNITNDPAFDTDPSFSPDGKHVVFSSGRDGNQEIYIADLDGSNVRRMTFDPELDTHAAFSPDGTQILFTSNRENENGDVYLMNVDGGGTFKLTSWDKSNETAGPGGWSPDGTKIVFFSDRNDKDDIYVVSAEIFKPNALSIDSTQPLRAPVYSPDGKHIAYSAETADDSGELRIFDLGRGRSELVCDTGLPTVAADWSAVDNRITFSDRRDGNSEVFVVDSDGKGLRNLTNDPALDSAPVWSPDGTHILFVSNRGGPSTAMRLYVMNSDGSDVRPVTPRSAWESDPSWNPDGRRIVFSCDRDDIAGNLMDICQINADGSGELRLLSRRDYDSRPVVSPDGTRIAFVATSDGNAEIYIMNTDGSRLFRLTRNASADLWPRWSPDGVNLIFSSDRSGTFALYEIEIPQA